MNKTLFFKNLHALPASVFATVACLLITVLAGCATTTKAIDAIPFSELWGYVMVGRENEFSPALPLTDVGYFWNAINTLGEVGTPPDRNKFFADYTGRVHLVSSCDSTGQTHFLLDPDLPLRDKIIKQLVEAAKTYDGLQIDWENIPAKDADNFHAFLREVKKQLGDKPLSVAVKARMRTIKDDVFSYEKIAAIADRLIIMAYDEHWSTSKPGPIASNDWGKKIGEYALTQIPKDKLIMGVSFYGRTWLSDSIGAKAWYNSGIERLIAENGIQVERDGDIPHFTYTHKATITGYYDDVESLQIRCRMYRDLGIENLAFWRIGFENPEFWQYLMLSQK